MDVADVTQAGSEGDGSSANHGSGAGCVRWEGFGEDPEHVGASEVRPGDVLIVDPSRGGLNAGTWDPSSTEPVTDLGDAAQMAYGRKATLRLDPRLLGTASPPLPADETEADSPPRERISQWLNQRLADPGDWPSWFSDAVGRLGSSFDFTPAGLDDEVSGGGYYVLTERRPHTERPVVEAATMDGSDESGSLTGTGVTLRRHLDGVSDRAGRIAKRLGLEAKLVEDLRLAGRLHDLGKADRRFQAQLVGGDPVALEMLEEPIAKSLPGARRIQRYPTGVRHEAASTALIESHPGVLDPAHDRDLVLHLVGTHHGWGRPLLPIVEDPEPQTLTYTLNGYSLEADSDLAESLLALDMADRFWRMVERYGYHGLAWLEAILRLADHQQSEEEEAA